MSEFLDNQWQKFLVALHYHDKEIYESKNGIKKMFKNFYIDTGNEIVYEPDAPKEVKAIIKQLDKDYMLPPFKK